MSHELNEYDQLQPDHIQVTASLFQSSYERGGQSCLYLELERGKMYLPLKRCQAKPSFVWTEPKRAQAITLGSVPDTWQYYVDRLDDQYTTAWYLHTCEGTQKQAHPKAELYQSSC